MSVTPCFIVNVLTLAVVEDGNERSCVCLSVSLSLSNDFSSLC